MVDAAFWSVFIPIFFSVLFLQFNERDSYSCYPLERRNSQSAKGKKKTNNKTTQEPLVMGNSWPAEWALDHNRWKWWQYTYSLQGQHCYEAIFLIHKNSYNPAYNLHRIYSPLAAAEVWADSSFVWMEHKENKMTLKSAAHLLKNKTKKKTHLPVPFLYGCCQVRETFCDS